MLRVAVDDIIQVLSSLVAPSTLIPSESVHWDQYWPAYDIVLVIRGDLLGVVANDDVDVCDTADGHGGNIHVTLVWVVLNVPVLSISQVGEDSSPNG